MRMLSIPVATLLATACSSICEHSEGGISGSDEVWTNSASCGPTNGLLPSVSQYEDPIRLTFFGSEVMDTTPPQLWLSQTELRAAIEAADPEGTELTMSGEWFINCRNVEQCHEVNGLTEDSTFTYLYKGNKENRLSGEYHRVAWDVTIGDPNGLYTHMWGEDWIGIDFW